MIRRLRYVGAHRPDTVRPMPAWPPARDPWESTADTVLMPAVGGVW